MTTSPFKHVCDLHLDTIVVWAGEGKCPFCSLFEIYERLKKQYELVKDQLEIAEQPTRD